MVLDMHQDLFSVKYSDGAPEWATLDEGKPHVTGTIWSDAYMLSEAVQTAFDNFWANKPAPDGIGVQDHYASLWKHVANRYKDNPTVIGYDIMNEPFPGSSALQGVSQFLQAYGALVYQLTGEVLSEQDLEATWGEADNRSQALRHLASEENYSQVVDAVGEFNREFDQRYLMPMYQKVSNAIREVDTAHVIFLEHSYYSNIGVSSGIERTKLPDGRPDPKVAYAPHAYDLVTDTRAAASSESARVAFIFERIADRSRDLDMPVWLGEWGAYYSHDTSIVPVAQNSVSLIEEHLFGHAYWSYDPGTENLAYFKQALLRPYPVYVNGQLMDYTYDFESSTFSMSWNEEIETESGTVIYVPWITRVNQDQLDGEMELVKIEGSEAGWIIIPANKPGSRSLRLHFAP